MQILISDQHHGLLEPVRNEHEVKLSVDFLDLLVDPGLVVEVVRVQAEVKQHLGGKGNSIDPICGK